MCACSSLTRDVSGYVIRTLRDKRCDLKVMKKIMSIVRCDICVKKYIKLHVTVTHYFSNVCPGGNYLHAN